MKLLICTQKVDSDDPILGFFHRWIKEFAKHCETIIVICLEKGEYNLPPNVCIFSLGKEKPRNQGLALNREKGQTLNTRLRYIWRFYKYIWQERKNYDSVFVHMNQEYVLLGGKFWFLLGKKIFLWRNHYAGNFLTNIASLFCSKVFCTSKYSYTAKYKKTVLMPVGIDTDFFKPDSSITKQPNSILFLGRIDPIKRVDVFIEALKELRYRGIKFSATIAGRASPGNEEYERMIRDKVKVNHLDDEVKFVGAVTQTEALRLYREHEVYVNLTPTGSMDKTIFEAMACGCLVVVANKAIIEIIDRHVIFSDNDPNTLSQTLGNLIKSPHYEDRIKSHTVYQDTISQTHSLKLLIGRLIEEFSV